MKCLKGVLFVLLIYIIVLVNVFCGKKNISDVTNESPVAAFKVTPVLGDTSTNFIFDASASTDLEDPDDSLKIRWDWDGDGVWDTNYMKNKKSTYRYGQLGSLTIILEVKDSDGLAGTVNQEIRIFDPYEMVYVLAGEFIMGNDLHFPDEQPAHVVYLDAYYIDKYEVTNDQFAIYLNSALESGEIQASGTTVTKEGVELIDLDDPNCQIKFNRGKFIVDTRKGKYPVIEVSWYGANAYAKFYSKRLPTEAEWEKAARGTDQRIYPWGNEAPSESNCNFNRNNVIGDPTLHNYTTPVVHYGQKGESPYGCVDMAGNVWEWCADLYDSGYYSNSPTNNPTGPSRGTFHVIRGGAWYSEANVIRCTFRGSGRYVSTGFRCVR